MNQQGDALLYQVNDDGEINISNGIVEFSGGLETAVFVSMFGGNEQDSGGDDSVLSWWANANEAQPERQYRSETQYLLRSTPAIPANLRRVEDAVLRDLSWLVEAGAASKVSAVASMPGLNRVKIAATIEAVGGPSEFEYIENWQAEL